MHRGYRYRIYPNREQERWLKRNIGCCRFVYNQMLGFKKGAYDAMGISMSETELKNVIPSLKRMYPFLKEAESSSLQQAVTDLMKAYENFFENPRKFGFPKFKSRKRSRASFRTVLNNSNIRISEDGRHVIFPKMGAVRIEMHRPMPEGWRFTGATVSQNRDGAWYISFQCESPEGAEVPVPDIDSHNAVGLDYKSSGLYADSDGGFADMPKCYRKSEKRLARAQRKLSKTQGARKGETPSKRHEKKRLAVAKISGHTANQRKDILHKKSTAIAKRYDIACVEDLDMKAMSRSLKLGKSTMDNGYGMFRNMLEYKMAERGKLFVKVDRWFPSSQMCSCCGEKNPGVKNLKVREWTCPVCGAHHDRDLNAAVNIRNEGLRMLGFA